MSAIIGIFFLDGRPVDRTKLERMLASVAHRGPDASKLWYRESVGLGHRMLWTTPESLSERLPLVNDTGDLVLTADARIDNRDELIAAIGLPARPHQQSSDSELILRAYEKWGERCLGKLVGDFAFVIWDGRRRVLFCARDHMGVKPFYYYQSDRVFVFASEIKALLCLPEVPCRLNEMRVADYLVPMLEDKVITFYQEILRLPPAHSMTVGCGQAPPRSYWSLDRSRQVRLQSDQEYAEAFRELFTEAVRCRLRSAFPVGSMLSGGLDSSSIVCVARKLLAQDGNRPLHTFSAIFDDVPQCDERPFINAVLAQGGLQPHYVHADRLSPLADLERVLRCEDEAFYIPNMFMSWALYGAAHRQGVRVFLSGKDGDTTVSHGEVYLTELARTGRWQTLAREVIGLSRHFDRSPWGILWRRALIPLTPEPVRQAWRALRGRNCPWRVNTTLNPHFARRIRLAERFQALQGNRSRPARSVREEHWRRLTWGLIPFTLEILNRAAAAFSFEPRYPFFDRRLVEFCLALPPAQKLHQGWTRIVVRRALANILPSEVQWRGGKSNLSPNFTRGLLAFERDRLEEVLFNEPNGIEEYVDLSVLREAYNRYVSQGTEQYAMMVWKAATLALWLRQTRLRP